jgi:L-methionine (R)-S-oxide reductase
VQQTVAIIDIDCKVVGGFDGADEEMLARMAQLLADSCDWPSSAGSPEQMGG